jgi:hypothetical protein
MTPGLARPPFLFEPLLSWTETHYNWTVAQGDRLAAGLRLGSQVRHNPVSGLFFSRHSYSLSLLTRRFNPLRVQDALSETITNSDFEVLVKDIYRLSPRVILFDPPDDSSLVVWAPEGSSAVVEDPAITYFYMRFFDRLKNRLGARYDQGSIMGGWQVWQSRLPNDNSDVLQRPSGQ